MPITTYINNLPNSEIEYVQIFENDYDLKDLAFILITKSGKQYQHPLNKIDRFLNISSGKIISQDLENQLYQHCAAWLKRDENQYTSTPLFMKQPNQKIEMQIKQDIEDITQILAETSEPKMLYLKQKSSHINDISLTL